MAKLTHAYFGDGVYAAFDGYHIVLSVNSPVNTRKDTIFLEPEMLNALKFWQQNGYCDHNSGLSFIQTQEETQP